MDDQTQQRDAAVSVTLQQVITADAVARFGGYAAAAAHIGGDRTAVKNLVRRLEKRLGVALFEIDDSGVRASSGDAASAAWDHIRDMVRAHDGLDELRHIPPTAMAPVRLAGFPAHAHLFGQAMRSWNEADLELSVELVHTGEAAREDGGKRLAGLLADREVEVVVLPGTVEVAAPDQYRHRRLYDWSLVVIEPPDSTPRTTPITIKQLARQPLLVSSKGHTTRDVLDELLAGESAEATVAYESSSFDVLAGLHQAGCGALVTASDAADARHLGPQRPIGKKSRGPDGTYELWWRTRIGDRYPYRTTEAAAAIDRFSELLRGP